jgi:secondary thiamine-phosphate synthase enzyme
MRTTGDGETDMGIVHKLTCDITGQGLHEITDAVEQVVARSGIREGLCTVYIQHTSASLTIQENADPAVQRDLERWLNRLVPEGDDLYTHTTEGPDDMPAHIKASLTAASLSIPVIDGRLALGTWQGIYLWEHRRLRGRRRVLVHLQD